MAQLVERVFFPVAGGRSERSREPELYFFGGRSDFFAPPTGKIRLACETTSVVGWQNVAGSNPARGSSFFFS